MALSPTHQLDQPGTHQSAVPWGDEPLGGTVHHDECEKALYEGGTCTCDLIADYGPPSDQDDE